METIKAIAQQVANVRSEHAKIFGIHKHGGDDFMYAVLVKDGTEWFVWDYNAQTAGLGNGFYGDQKRTWECYQTRVARTVGGGTLLGAKRND